MTISTDDHKINRIRISLLTDNVDNATDLQERCSQLFLLRARKIITYALELLAHPDNKTVVINQLKLKLNELSLSDFEDVFCQQLMEHLCKELDKYMLRYLFYSNDDRKLDTLASISKLSTSTPDLGRPEIPENTLKNIKRLSAQVGSHKGISPLGASIPSGSISAQASLRQYLFHGYLSSPICLRGGESIDDWLLDKINEDEQKWRPLFLQAVLNSISLKRLVNTFSPKTVAQITKVLIQVSDEESHPSGVKGWLRDLHQKSKDFSGSGGQLSSDSLNSSDILKNANRLPISNSLTTQVTPHAKTTKSGPISIPIENAGLVLLWPIIPNLLTQLELMENNTFCNEEAKVKAACWFDWLVWRDVFPAEWRMTLNKVLCALPLNTSIEPTPVTNLPNSDAALNHIEQELSQIWSLRRCNWNDIRDLFLCRLGYLTQGDEAWSLVVDTDASDILLRDIPWPMDEVYLPWLDSPLQVNWL